MARPPAARATPLVSTVRRSICPSFPPIALRTAAATRGEHMVDSLRHMGPARSTPYTWLAVPACPPPADRLIEMYYCSEIHAIRPDPEPVMTSYADLLVAGTRRLSTSMSPRLDAEVLLRHAAGLDRAGLMIALRETAPPD